LAEFVQKGPQTLLRLFGGRPHFGRGSAGNLRRFPYYLGLFPVEFRVLPVKLGHGPLALFNGPQAIL
jgi:hypothetical protein